MAERIIHSADLSALERSLTNVSSRLNEIDRNVASVGVSVETVRHEVGVTRQELAHLEKQFLKFVQDNIRNNNMQQSRTELVRIRQELEEYFGHYSDIRRHATGILQATDLMIVRQIVVDTATEELMLKAPRYWLAPTMVALSAWLRDDRALAERALAEALRRSDEKTSLFFALVCRRAGRDVACKVWMDRYLAIQDPSAIGRQTLVLLDAIVNGILGIIVKQDCSQYIHKWIEELALDVSFKDTQRENWYEGFKAFRPQIDFTDLYVPLVQYSPSWQQLSEYLNDCCMHGVVLEYLKNIFEGTLPSVHSIHVAVDDLLSKLVTNMDDEELPLMRSKRRNELVLEHMGDMDRAKEHYEAESSALEAKVSFTQLLTNIALSPRLTQTSIMTQRFAVAASKEWALEAYGDLIASIRRSTPKEIEISIEGWSGSSEDGSNQEELETLLGNEIESRKKKALADIRISIGTWLLFLGSAAVSAWGLYSGVFWLGWAGVFGSGHILYKKYRIHKIRSYTINQYDKLGERCRMALLATLAALTDWRRAATEEDMISESVVQYISDIDPNQHMLTPRDGGRQLMA